MILFYLIALLLSSIFIIAWAFSKKINAVEALIACSIIFFLAGVFHFSIANFSYYDTQTISGQITHAKKFSAWKEYYEEEVYRTEYYTDTESYTDDKGRTRTRTVRKSRRVFDHWEPNTRWHKEYIKAYSNINTDYDIDEQAFKYFCKQFNHVAPEAGNRTTFEHASRMIAGDPNDYVSYNHSGIIEPVTKSSLFKNKIKYNKSVFSFVDVPTNIFVYKYPDNSNPWMSSRVIGIANNSINNRKWDQLNSYLGPIKKINLIIIGYDKEDSSLGEYQEAEFLGGKKNDLVIVYGPNNKNPTWCKTFGWTESFELKQSISSYVIENGVNDNLLDFLRSEVTTSYKIKDWSKFDYLSVEPQMKHYTIYFCLSIIISAIMIVIFLKNDIDKIYDTAYTIHKYRNKILNFLYKKYLKIYIKFKYVNKSRNNSRQH